MKNQNISHDEDYKYGFTTDIENIKAPKGLSEKTIKFISKIKKDLEGQKKFPPVDQWNPDLCEGQEFFIDREGDWFYNNSPIKNKKLINLFSTVIRKDDDNYFPPMHQWQQGERSIDKAQIVQEWLTIKNTMWNYVGLNRTSNRLNRAKAMFNELSDEIVKFYKNATLQDNLIGLRNSVEVAMMVLNASVRNKDSVGCFHRED